ncbi:ras guanine nucleotide exchange factor domain-containing protein [Phlyctochytrium arcticum]|nr:ras guanine nucleotide exchange factor domain-containing protein [Phlyctochytrium arcticum]
MDKGDPPTRIPEILDLFDSYPVTAQLDLVELLLRKAATRRTSQQDATHIDNSWNRISDALDHALRGARPQAATHRRMSSAAPSERDGERSNIRIPEEVRPVLLKLKAAQQNEAATLFEELDISSITRMRPDRQSPDRELPFELLEKQVLTILLNTPLSILRSPPQLISDNATSSPTTTKLATEVVDPRSPLAQVLTASSALAALIEAIVSAHNDQILAELNDQSELESYQVISERVWEATLGILKDVKLLKEGLEEADSVKAAKDLYAHIILMSSDFVDSLNEFLNFALNTLGSSNLRHPPIRTDSAISFLSAPPSPPHAGSSWRQQPSRLSDPLSPLLDSNAKRISFGARLKRRLAQLTGESRRTSLTSLSSEEGTEVSFATRYSRPSEENTSRRGSESRTGSLDIPRRGKSVDLPRRPRNSLAQVPVGRSSMDALRPKGRSRSSADVHRRSFLLPESSLRRSISSDRSTLTVPRLPEISFGSAKATEWLAEVFSSESGSRERQPSGSSTFYHATGGSLSPTEGRNPSPSPSLSDQQTPGAPSSPHISSPTTPRRVQHGRTPSSSSKHSITRVHLQQEEWRRRLPSDAGTNYEPNTDRWSRMLESLIGSVGEEELRLVGLERENAEKKKADAESKKASNRFESLRKLGYKISQRIPTFDSQGNRIGILDHWQFLSGVEEHGDVQATDFISVRGNLLHMSEDDHDVMIMEMLEGKLLIMAGTAEKLVLTLADETLQDAEFVDIFIRNHPFYMSSRDLMTNLVTRFYCEMPEAPSEEEKMYFFEWQRVIQTKVLAVVGRWVKLRFEDFTVDAELRAGLEQFLAEAADAGFSREASRIRRVSIVQALSISNLCKQAPLSESVPSEYRGSSPFPMHVSQPLLESSPLLMFDARDIARYLTLADAAGFKALTTCDFVQKLRAGGTTGSRIDWFARRANTIRNWVTLELCTLYQRKLRRKLLEKFINVAWYCRSQRNYHTSLFILSALHSPAVQRLKKTWDGIPNVSMERLKLMEKLLDLTGNMRELRRAIEEDTACGALPFLPVVMKDATFIVEGNPEFVEPAARNTSDNPVISITTHADNATSHPNPPMSPSSPSPQLINFDKYRTLTRNTDHYMALVDRYVWTEPLATPEALEAIPRIIESRLQSADDEGAGHIEGTFMRWATSCVARCSDD